MLPNLKHIKSLRLCVFAFIYFCVLITTIHATHIVGGEMNYTCLGNDDYEITLTIFRDCYNGNPNAWFDDPASIGVFSAQNDLLFEVQIPWDAMLNDTLNPVLSNSCFVIPPDVCVHTTTYTTTVNLPPRIGGYQLAYQRCCRNETIVNIIDPLDTGATYGVTISEAALLGCNSSPKFREWPPLYICVNEPIVFDQSAVDTDGDSIVYRLCTPLQGANPDDPQPQPPNPPPYDPIRWVNPPYSEQNMLNGSPADPVLRIDPRTGLLTGLPNTIGQFVVGVCVEEYRSGQLIATTRRDFQYNVGICGQAVSAFAAPQIQCNDLRVVFDNQSLGTERYLWSFGDGTTSTLINPVHTYPDTGSYNVQLIVDPGGICADTFQQEVLLRETQLVADFEYDFLSCNDTLLVQFTDTSIHPADENLTYAWSVDGVVEDSAANSILSFYENRPYVIQLTVTGENGCPSIATDTINAPIIEGRFLTDTIQICRGESVRLTSTFDEELRYHWQPTTTLDFANTPTPTATPDTTTTYQVQISNPDNFCQIEREIVVKIPPPIGLRLPNDTTICSPFIALMAETDEYATFQWTNGIEIISIRSDARLSPLQSTTYQVQATDEFGCTERDSIIVTGNAVRIELDSSQLICPNEATTLTIRNLVPTDTLNFNWQPADLILSGANTATPVVRPDAVGRQVFTVEMSNQNGCTRLDSTAVIVIDTTDQLDFISATQCSGFEVQFSASGDNAPYYEWHFGDPLNFDPTAVGANPTYIYRDTGSFLVTVSLPESLSCATSFTKIITVGEPQISMDFIAEVSECAATAEVTFVNQSINNQSEIVREEWRILDRFNFVNTPPTITIDSSQTIFVTLLMTSSDGCMDSLTKEFTIDLIENTIPDSVAICNGDAAELNPSFNPNYQYQWSPAMGLDDANAANPFANPTTTTTYQVTISDTNNLCELVTEVTAVVPPPIRFTTPNDTTICENEIELQLIGEDDYEYEWSTDRAYQNIISTTAQVTAQPLERQFYFVRATDELGCQLRKSFSVTSGTLDLLLPSEQTICINHPTQLPIINLNASFPTTYEWSPTDSMDDSRILQPTVNPSESTTYTVNAQNSIGCTFTGSTRVNVFNFIPPLEVTTDKNRLETADDFAQLNATEAPDYTYEWSPKIGLDDPFIPNPIAQPTETTTYTLTITNRDGCTNTRSILIEVLNLACLPPNIFIPQAFSPNGDGKNDVLYVRGVPIESLYFAIYNRWGELVFETEDVHHGWDGTVQGEAAPAAVFGYYVRVVCFDGTEYIDKGNVTLIR